MPLRNRFARRCLFLLLLAVGAGTVTVAGPKPLPELTPEETELRGVLHALRAGGTEVSAEAVQPLRDWLDARHAVGDGRSAERELRRTLKRMHDDTNRDLLRAAQWIRRLQIQRTKLYQGLTEEKVGLERTLEKYNESPPVPEIEELLPGDAGIADAYLLGTDAETATDAPDAAVVGDSLADAGGPRVTAAADADMDETRLLNRLTLDLTILGHVLHQCDNEYEAERDRHKAALAALEAFLQDFRSARSGSGK